MFANDCFDHHWNRVATKHNKFVHQSTLELGLKATTQAVESYVKDFFNDAWPHWLTELWQVLKAFALQNPTDGCGFCGFSSREAAYQQEQHICFQCQRFDGVTLDSYENQRTMLKNEACKDKMQWFRHIRELSRNPLKHKTGLSVIVRFFYYDALLKCFSDQYRGLLVQFPTGDASIVTKPPDWDKILKKYKQQVKEITKQRGTPATCIDD